ncbi:CS and HSP20-like domain protein [Pseudohyphozyma bogoriensis]|nr:CS and HSP20-like domain protein [Pseudohyphozyma bogoriensis]
MSSILDHDPFPTNRTLLNPVFESFKLVPSSSSSSSSSSTSTASYALPGPGAKLKTLPDSARLSYAQVQDRVRFNHLAAGKSGELVFVDADGSVVAITLNETGVPTFHNLLTLPPTVSSSSLPTEYPHVLPLTPTAYLVSPGTGILHLLTLTTTPLTATLAATFTLSSDFQPFRVHSADLSSSTGEILLFLSIATKSSSKPATQKISGVGSAGGSTTVRDKIESTTAFEFIGASLGRLEEFSRKKGEEKEMEERWRLKSSELPAYVRFDAASDKYFFGGASTLFDLDAPAPPPFNPDNPFPPPQFASSSTSPIYPPSASSSIAPLSANVPKPPPFSWSQDSDSLTVAIPVPSTTPTSSIRVTFSKEFLTLHIASAHSLLQNPSQPPTTTIHISHKKLWDKIDPYSSVWTFDREAEGRDTTYGILSLHLEKANPGTKWSDVFMETVSSPEHPVSEQEKELENVRETVDPSELAGIVESLEKYTQGQGGGAEFGVQGGGDGYGIGMGVPTSLKGDEMDVEVDGEVGRGWYVTEVRLRDGGKEGVEVVRPHPAFQHSLLSLPLPSAAGEETVVIKHDVDGLVFSPPTSSTTTTGIWSHVDTFPALSFILATKTSASHIYHTPSYCLAFDAPSTSASLSSVEGGVGVGNLFVYYKPEKRAKNGKQRVVRMSPGAGGLLGVAETGKWVVALFERELAVWCLEE